MKSWRGEREGQAEGKEELAGRREGGRAAMRLAHFALFFIFLLLLSSSAFAVWWNASWGYRKKLEIQGVSGAGTDYVVRVHLHWGTGTDDANNIYLNGHANSDFSDVRFVNEAGTTSYSYWKESYVANGDANFLVRITDNLDTNKYIYVYYGNPDAADAGSASATFDFWYDYSSGTYTSDWAQDFAVNGGVTYTYYDGGEGKLMNAKGSGDKRTAYIKTFGDAGLTSGTEYIVEARVKIESDTSPNDWTERYVMEIHDKGKGLADWGITKDRIHYYDGADKYVPTDTTDTYHIYGGGMDYDTNEFYIFKDYNLVVKFTATGTAITTYIRQIDYARNTSGDYNVTRDWIRVRKFVCPEPRVGLVFTEETSQYSICFYDESDMSDLNVTIIIDGTNYGFKHCVSFDETFGNKTHSVSAHLDGYKDRNWLFYFGTLGKKMLGMLKEDEGRFIDFSWSSDCNAKIVRNNLIAHYNAGNEIFLNPTADYSFYLYCADANYQYATLDVNILPPKDEYTNNSISGNFKISISGLANKSYDVNESIIINVLPLTLQAYYLLIDKNTDYYNRQYTIYNSSSDAVIQPYLVPVSVGSAVYFNAKNIYVDMPVEGVFINIYKTIENTEKLVSSVLTDTTGRALVPLIGGDFYRVVAYYNNEQTTDSIIQASASDYYIFVSSTTTTVPTSQQRILQIDFTPSEEYIAPTVGNFCFSLYFSQLSNISEVNIKITQKNNTLVDENKAVTQGTTLDYNVPQSSIAAYIPIIITVSTLDGKIKTGKTYVPHFESPNLFSKIQTIKVEFGDAGALIVAIITTLIAVGAITVIPATNYTFAVFVALAVMGFFVYVGFFPLVWYLVMAAGAFGSILLKGGINA